MTEFKKFLDNIYPLSAETWNKLMPLVKATSLEKGEFFVREREIATEFAFLSDGIVRAFYTSDEGKEYTKHFFRFPSIIGSYSSLISQKRGMFSHQAITPCKLFTINYKELLCLYDTCHDLERLGRKFAENYFVFNEAKEINFVLHDADIRYLEFRNQFPDIENSIPQYHVASYLGISATQLSRIRKKLKK